MGNCPDEKRVINFYLFLVCSIWLFVVLQRSKAIQTDLCLFLWHIHTTVPAENSLCNFSLISLNPNPNSTSRSLFQKSQRPKLSIDNFLNVRRLLLIATESASESWRGRPSQRRSGFRTRTWRTMRRKWKWLESSTSTSTPPPQTTGSISILLLLLLLLLILRLRLRLFPERNRIVVWPLLFSVAPSPPESNSAGPCSSLSWLPTFRSVLSLFKFVFVFCLCDLNWCGLCSIRIWGAWNCLIENLDASLRLRELPGVCDFDVIVHRGKLKFSMGCLVCHILNVQLVGI